MMSMLGDYILSVSRAALIVLSLCILTRCLRSMLREKIEPEIWAYIRVGSDYIPVNHWETLIGRSRSADIRIFGSGIGRLHAVLTRSDRGEWRVFDIFSRGGVWVNGERVPGYGTVLHHGDVISLGGSCVRFHDISTAERQANEHRRTGAGKAVNPAVTLLELTAFECFLTIQHYFTAGHESFVQIAVCYATLAVLQWCVFELMRLMDRLGFEIEILAFYLTAVGLSVAASSTPEDVYKQIILIVCSVLLFVAGGWWLRNLRRTSAMRIPFAILALAMLAVNIVTADTINGAKNWLTFGGYSFQPSELVKVFYIYAGAATLDRLYRKKNLFAFMAFSAVCVVALALIGDFGTALVFFATYLVISFMRSGSIATVFLSVTGALMAGIMAVSIKPYIAARFAIWGHAWDDIYDAGYQQTRAISAAASGGLVGKGAGGGWLRNIVASNTDMVFAYVCEELGLVVAVCMVVAVLLMAFFAIRCSKNGRSAYYGIAACATSAMLLVQMALNVFGSLDMLPFTGVTFPFVSRGGSSLISCWMLMGYLKSTDNRRGASFAVRPVKKLSLSEAPEEIAPEEWESEYDEKYVLPESEEDGGEYDEDYDEYEEYDGFDGPQDEYAAGAQEEEDDDW